MQNLKTNPKELREFQMKAFKEALKKPDSWWPYYNYSMFNLNIKKIK